MRMSGLLPPARFVPEDGPENPVFMDVDAGDIIQATLLFSQPLAEDDLDVVEPVVLAWFADADWGGTRAELVDETLTATALHVAVTGVRSARAALGSLLDSLHRACVPVARAVLARVRADGDRDALVRAMDAEARAQVRYDDSGEWWKACFDTSAPPPISEDKGALASDADALIEIAQTTFAERRFLPLHVPAFRICWGLGELGFADEDARTHDVARVFRAALRARFAPSEPIPYDRHQRATGAVDRIVSRGRTGYSCALQAGELREFLYGSWFRYREYELMLAARDAAVLLELEPVVCWRRFAGRYVVQLWEPDRSRVTVAA